MEHIDQDGVIAKRPRLARVRRVRAIKADVKKRLGQVRDEIHDPILTVLTILLAFVIFVVVPLHAAGFVLLEGYSFVIILLLASCVLVLSKKLMAIFLIMLAVGLAAAAVVLRMKPDLPSTCMSRREQALSFAACSSLWSRARSSPPAL